MINGKRHQSHKPEWRKTMLDAGFMLYSQNGIESVRNDVIAEKAGRGIATFYRYFCTTEEFVVEISAVKWKEFNESYAMSDEDLSDKTAEDMLRYFLESFIELYRNHRDLLRFNQFFNTYIGTRKVSRETLEPYVKVIGRLKERFHVLYEKAKADGTVSTSEPEDEMFSTILHLMLAAATRYAVGLIYEPEGFDGEKELEKLKTAMLMLYVK